MKRICLCTVVIVTCLCCLSGCLLKQFTPGGYAPGGYVKKEEHFDPYGWQDYVDYCKYYYSDKSKFENNGDYRVIAESDVESVRGYFEDFRGWMDTTDRTDEYDFDDTCITAGDYVCVLTKEGKQIGNSSYGKYDDYSVYFFDADSGILYYIHANI